MSRLFLIVAIFCMGAGWDVDLSKDEMTDEDRVAFTKASEENARISLVGLCEDGQLIGVGIHIPGMDGTPSSSFEQVMLRFDGNDPITDRTAEATPSSVLIPDPGRYLVRLLTSERLLVRYQGINRIWTWSFQLEGLQDVLEAHTSVCGPVPELPSP